MATSTDYDLNTCSGCCIAPPSGCCGSGVATTLTATFGSSGACACPIGATISIVWNGTAWVGSGTPGTCGNQFNLSMTCVAGNYQMVLSFPGGCRANITCGLVSASCSPFSQVFNVVGTAFGANCGCTSAPMAAAFTITVT